MEEENKNIQENTETPVENQNNVTEPVTEQVVVNEKPIEQIIEEMPHNTKKSNKGVIILLIVIIIALAGYIGYKQFFGGDKPKPPKENDTSETSKETSKESSKEEEKKETSKESETNKEEKQNTPLDINNLAGVTFKTSDGKKVLFITKQSKNDNGISYEATYNNKKYDLYLSLFTHNSNSKYILLEAAPAGGYDGQCAYENNYIINITDQTLVNLDYTSSTSYYKIDMIGDNYYFSRGICSMGFGATNVYDENLKEIGNEILGIDKNNNFYVSYNESVIKYDKDANIIKKSSNKYDHNKIYNNSEIGVEPILTENNLYFIYASDKENADYIIVDFMNDKEYNFTGTATNNYILDRFYLDEANNSIVIKFELNTELCTNCDSDKEIDYSFDLSTNNITKK